jgi:cytochrome c oxidase subunit 3
METPQQAIGGVANQVMANNGEFNGPNQNLSYPGLQNLLHWLPLWNTVVLLTSSLTCHIAHKAILVGNKSKFNFWLLVTVALGFIFVFLQYKEYHEAIVEYGLTLKSGIYGTTFFMLTGFHGFHVCMGAVMLLIQLIRSTKAGHFTAADHFGFEASSWYWHFVDVVWVGLFLFVYIL